MPCEPAPLEEPEVEPEPAMAPLEGRVIAEAAEAARTAAEAAMTMVEVRMKDHPIVGASRREAKPAGPRVNSRPWSLLSVEIGASVARAYVTSVNGGK